MVYQDIIHVSNDIRFILDTTRMAHLTAINAALAARRAGSVKGFETVAGELKSFSLRLTTTMHEISVFVLMVSQAVSNLYRQRHSLRNHETAYTLSQVSSQISVLASAKARHRALSGILLEKVRQLAFHVACALRLCLTGRNFARAAMVEAAHGGDAAAMLKTVALDIESTIDNIHDRLKAIHQRIRP